MSGYMESKMQELYDIPERPIEETPELPSEEECRAFADYRHTARKKLAENNAFLSLIWMRERAQAVIASKTKKSNV